jgi:DnaJ-class molecular chaperone
MINNAKEDDSATEDDCRSDLSSTESNPCPTCNGSGKVITGYGVVCTEIVEKIAECSDCGGKGS